MSTILISGAGSGVGRATSLHLAKAGHNLILFGRNREKLLSTLNILPHGDHIVLTADITKKLTLVNAMQVIREIPLDAIIAISGLGGVNKWGEHDNWNGIIDTNLTGTYNFVNTFLPNIRLSSAECKHIIVVSSALAHLGIPGYEALSASKAGLHALTRCWATTMASENILVNAIAPGWINTQMADKEITGLSKAYNVTQDQARETVLKNVPLKRMSEPEEIAQLILSVLMLTTITGSIIDINGGLVMPN
jgi:NAD(P)-dependent dehydrogenase (short-subunit alcohol dehydrogenase family)